MPTIKVVGPDQVDPQLGQVLRNDQTITWQLEENVAWDPLAGDQAVRFLGETGFYSAWPGKPPAPVGPPPEHDQPDRRDYMADAEKEMAAREFHVYHYEIAAMIIPTGHRFTVSVRRGKEWYDPEVVNEPRP
jgi:hypothetical protein